jgi:uncharacterized membrane protein YeaQ/YmgE (transglycosylase-associated protein family)
MRLNTRQLTLAAVLAAVYLVLRSTPTFQMVGISGRFTAGDFMLPTIVLLAGPWGGLAAVFVGTILAFAVSPPIFFGLDFLPGIVNVAIMGSVLSSHRQVARLVYIIVFATFLVSPYSLLFGYGYVPYAWLHIIALAILLSPVSAKIPSWLEGRGLHQLAAVGTLAFIGTMAQHLTGGLLYEMTAGYLGGITPDALQQFWRIIFWLYPIERLLVTCISSAVALALMRATRKWTIQSSLMPT